MIRFFLHPRGFGALMMVVVISVSLLLISLTMAGASLQELKSTVHHAFSARVFVWGEGCLERTLLRLNRDHQLGDQSFVSGDLSCTVTVTGAGNTRTLQATAAQGALYVHRLEATADFSSGFRVNQWRELN